MTEDEEGAEVMAQEGTVVDPRRLHEAGRIAEALVFASAGPVSEAYIAERLPRGVDVQHVMRALKGFYAGRGVNLVQVGDSWAFRTAPDMSFVIRTDETEMRKLSRAALAVLSIIAYHQSVTRAEIEDIRGWVRFRGRRRSPGRPVTFGTTRDFLDHFGLEELRDLPGLDELKGAGLLSGRIPANFQVPLPLGENELAEDEDPITQLDLEELGLLTPGGGDGE